MGRKQREDNNVVGRPWKLTRHVTRGVYSPVQRTRRGREVLDYGERRAQNLPTTPGKNTSRGFRGTPATQPRKGRFFTHFRGNIPTAYPPAKKRNVFDIISSKTTELRQKQDPQTPKQRALSLLFGTGWIWLVAGVGANRGGHRRHFFLLRHRPAASSSLRRILSRRRCQKRDSIGLLTL